MPDPKQMSGIPRPVDDLPSGSISVRLIRGQLSNNITNHPVQLRVGDKTLTVNTDDAGRAQFDQIAPGSTVKATADVDGEHLESQEFAAPPRGGIRLMLVATDPNKKANPQAAPVSGEVRISNESRIVMEPGDEAVTVYYLLEIVNPASTPVQPANVFMFDVPKDAIGTTLMQGTTPQASTQSGRVRIEGPFAPGNTSLQVGFEIPARSGDIAIAQKFPAALEHLAVVVKKVGEATLSSPQITRQQEFPVAEGVYIAGTGGAIAAGQPIDLEVTGLPHHSAIPSSLALAIAAMIVVGGAFMSSAPGDEDKNARAAERKRLIARRDKLFNELIRLEHEYRGGRADERRYRTRREELLAALENVYGALDSDESAPDPADHARVGAPLGALEAS
jgi:hypothetical protein